MDHRGVAGFVHPDGGVVSVPIWDPDSPYYRMRRVTDPDGNPAAFAAQHPDNLASTPVRFMSANDGVLALAKWEVYDDFEYQSLGDGPRYWGHTSQFAVTTTSPIESGASLASTDTHGKIASPDLATPRGYEYRISARLDTAGECGLLVAAQDAAYPWADCYHVALRTSAPHIVLQRRLSGSTTTLRTATYGGGVSTGQRYDISLGFFPSGMHARLLTPGGDRLVQTDWAADTTHSGGYLGFYGGSTTAAHFDRAIRYTI